MRGHERGSLVCACGWSTPVYTCDGIVFPCNGRRTSYHPSRHVHAVCDVHMHAQHAQLADARPSGACMEPHSPVHGQKRGSLVCACTSFMQDEHVGAIACMRADFVHACMYTCTLIVAVPARVQESRVCSARCGLRAQIAHRESCTNAGKLI